MICHYFTPRAWPSRAADVWIMASFDPNKSPIDSGLLAAR